MITSMNEKNECRTAAAVAAPHRGKLEGAMGLPAKAMAKARGRAISLLFIYHIFSSQNEKGVTTEGVASFPSLLITFL